MPTAIKQDLQLRLRDSGGTYTFDFPGQLELIDQQRIHQDTAGVPELAKIIETWEATRCRISAADANLLFDKFDTFQSFINDRTGTPLTAFEIIRPAAGNDSVEIERVLSTANYQRIILESMTIEDEIPDLEQARLRSVMPVTLRISAERVFPDGNGIVNWNQRIINTYRNGLHQLEYVTEIETAEGTDARTKAKSFAKIHIATFGNTYVWSEETNGPDGIVFDEVDARTFDNDTESASRVPRFVVARSKIEQLGFSTGASASGNSINGPIVLRNETIIEGTTTTTERTAEAHGPGALAWVESKRLSGDLQFSSEAEETAERGAFGFWRKIKQTQAEARWKVRAVISGDAQDEEFVALTGVQPPLLTIGPLQRARLDVDIVVDFVGAQPTRDDMAFPSKLSLPWRLQLNKSKEDAFPEILEHGASIGQDKWQRKATLVYEASIAPPYNVLIALAERDPKKTVKSYWL